MSDLRRSCDTCKHNPPSKEWPCTDCDMREPADRWEPKDVGDMISRQKAIDICNNAIDLWNGQIGCGALVAVKDAISRLTSAEPEIVHCKDCKFWTHIKRTNRYWCKTDDGLYDLNPSPDDFCSRAERRTDE